MQEADFFSTISTLRSIIADNVQATHQHHAHDCPIAATFGYRGSNAASESLTVNPFGIYHLISVMDYSVLKALVLGDFRYVISLCLSVH